jgi:hypothetical protein
MAVKKTKASAKKASAKKAATKKAAPKKATKAAPARASKTVKAKAGTTAKNAKAKKTTSTAVKLTDRQLDMLKAVHGSKAGYLANKAEAKTLDALASKKLIKKGAKDKASGAVRYQMSKAGVKFVTSPSAM